MPSAEELEQMLHDGVELTPEMAAELTDGRDASHDDEQAGKQVHPRS